VKSSTKSIKTSTLLFICITLSFILCMNFKNIVWLFSTIKIHPLTTFAVVTFSTIVSLLIWIKSKRIGHICMSSIVFISLAINQYAVINFIYILFPIVSLAAINTPCKFQKGFFKEKIKNLWRKLKPSVITR
jgi:hypothetical protein